MSHKMHENTYLQKDTMLYSLMLHPDCSKTANKDQNMSKGVCLLVGVLGFDLQVPWCVDAWLV